MHIAVLNTSTLVSNQDVQLMTQAVQIQLDLHFLPAWNLKDCTISFYEDKTKVPGYAWVVNVLDNPDVAGALGYHTENNDKIDAFIFCQPVLSNGGVALYDSTNPQNVSVASVLSHEVCEMVCDRFANFWADGPTVTQDGYTFSQYALEVCDPVESDSYVISVGSTPVSVSNFVFPSWFNTQATSVNLPFDYLNKLTVPFSMTSGGYIVLRAPGEVETQIFGHKMPEWKRELKKSQWYRR